MRVLSLPPKLLSPSVLPLNVSSHSRESFALTGAMASQTCHFRVESLSFRTMVTRHHSRLLLWQRSNVLLPMVRFRIENLLVPLSTEDPTVIDRFCVYKTRFPHRLGEDFLEKKRKTYRGSEETTVPKKSVRPRSQPSPYGSSSSSP